MTNLKKHVLTFIGVAVAVVVAAAPTILTTPAVEHFVQNHPGVAAWVPIVTGLISAIAKAYHERVSSQP